MEAVKPKTDSAGEHTIKMGDYLITLKFQGLSGIQEIFENLLKWHIQNDEE